MTRTSRIAAALSLALLVALTGATAAQTPPATPMEWVAAMVNLESGGTAWVTLHANGFSSPDVVKALQDMLKDKGQDVVVTELNAMPATGYIRTSATLAYDLPVIRYIPTATGYRIVGVCAREIGPVGMARQGVVTRDYPLGVVILNVNKDGKSEGQILPAVKARFDKEGKFEPDTYGTQPIRLFNIKELPPKK
jgi:hypothetical protein